MPDPASDRASRARQLGALRAHAICRSLSVPSTLSAAVHRLGFVQADPICAPAKAEDLILRHRVVDYRAGDLEQQYPTIAIEEGMVYAYGFLASDNWRLAHPPDRSRLSSLERRVLEAVAECGAAHPRDLQASFGDKRARNAWGGYSRVTKLTLESLHRRGLLRIARRDRGVRVYESAPPAIDVESPTERLRALVLIAARILAPLSRQSLGDVASRIRRSVPGLTSAKYELATLLRRGELEQDVIDGVTYLWPPRDAAQDEVAPRVRFLAPFDPIVWDRRRVEHLWGWRYRFEAYTPPAKRVLGYYAMPLLWRDQIIGWANVARGDPRVHVELGFIHERPRTRQFDTQLELEVERMQRFLERDDSDSDGSECDDSDDSERDDSDEARAD